MLVGERIRSARKSAGLTQKQLGEKCGIAEPTIRRYELGKLNPKLETLKKIAAALNISTLYFMELSDEEDSNSLERAKEDYKKRIEDLQWEEITVNAFNVIYGEKWMLPIKYPGTDFEVCELTIFGRKPGKEIAIGPDEIYTISCALRGVFTSLVELLGEPITEAIKGEEVWMNSTYSLLSIIRLLPEDKQQQIKEKIRDELCPQNDPSKD